MLPPCAAIRWEPLRNISLRLEGSVWGIRYSQKEPLCRSCHHHGEMSIIAAEMGSGKQSLWPPAAAARCSHPSDLESYSYYSWLLPRVNSDAPVWGGGHCNHCLTFKNKTLPWHWRKEEGRCISTGEYMLMTPFIAWNGPCHVGDPCLHTFSVAFLIFVSLRFYWKSLFYKWK